MELDKELADRKRKRYIQIIFIVFIVTLVLFTLFSNTLQSLTLPKVRTEKSAIGKLVHKLEGSDILRPLTEVELPNPAGWKVRQVLVKEGDLVEKGQKLILYDSKSAERELEDEIIRLEKQKFELENVQDQFIQASMDEDEFKIRSVRREIEMSKLDLGVQERKINELRDRLTSSKEIMAPFDGIITRLNAVEGLASQGEPDLVISNYSQGYGFEVAVDSKLLSSLGISIGEKVQVEVNTAAEQQTRMIDGEIDQIVKTESRTEEAAGKSLAIPQKILRIKVVDSELKGGEQAWIKIEKRSRLEGIVIPNTAIHQDHEGRFVYKVEERRGALGNVFVALKVRIHARETNGQETVIQSDMIYEDDLIILESSEPLQDGNRIRLQ